MRRVEVWVSCMYFKHRYMVTTMRIQLIGSKAVFKNTLFTLLTVFTAG